MSPALSDLRRLLPPPGAARPLSASMLARAVGRGLMWSSGILYFNRVVGVPVEQIGLGLTIAAVVGIAAGIPSGHIADLFGPRNVTTAFAFGEGLMAFCYPLVGGFAGFTLLVCAVAVCETGGSAARGALVAGAVAPDQRVKVRAYLRSVSNVGVTVGALLAGWGLIYDSRAAYLTLIAGGGLCYVLAAAAYLLLPAVRAQPKPADAPRWLVIRDVPYASLALLSSVLLVNQTVLTIVLPLWIAQQTVAPVSVYAVLLMLNTILVVLFQVRVSAGATTVSGAARAQRRAGLVIAGCFLLYALASGASEVWQAVAVMVVGVVVHTVGELMHEAGSWGVQYELAPEHAHGQYQGLYSTGRELAGAVTPAVATVVVVGWGWPGWLFFAVVVAAAGFAIPPTARWAERTRSKYFVITAPAAPAAPAAAPVAE